MFNFNMHFGTIDSVTLRDIAGIESTYFIWVLEPIVISYVDDRCILSSGDGDVSGELTKVALNKNIIVRFSLIDTVPNYG